MSSVSVVFPLYLPSLSHKEMTDKNLYLAKTRTSYPVTWVILETASSYYLNEADIYIYEKERTRSVDSHNRAFKSCTTDYIAYLANDVTVCEGWIEKMLACFEKHPDCAIASLGNNEHADPITNDIVEDFYFSVCMLKRGDAWYTDEYKSNFLDTDLAMRLRVAGGKFYKNLSGQVFHKPHSTVGAYSGDKADFERCRQHFAEKYKAYASDPWYRKFAGVA